MFSPAFPRRFSVEVLPCLSRWFLWDHWAHCGIFENRGLLMYTLEGVANFITAYEESQ